MGSVEVTVDVEDILSKLDLKEKISLLAAIDWWRTPVIKRDGVFVPHIKTTDGPNGARGESYVSGIKAACFPCATSLGATFDTDLLYHVGQEVAKEAITKSANILLAPTLNVIRSPLGGRNYETYSEDPFVLGTLAAAYVNGCQSQGIAATPKHFVANDAENQRTTLSAEIDEQTLREIYLLPFQLVMKLSDPWCFMTSYNKVNGTYVADDARLVQEVLRKEWGFKGAVVSDWMGVYSVVESMKAGVDLEMPGPPRFRGERLLQAVQDGLVSEKFINESARRVLELAKRLGRFENPEEPPERAVDDPRRDQFIADGAAEGIVMLKNDGGILPLPKTATVAMIGHHATNVTLGGGGSARVDALHAVDPVEGMQKLGFNTKFAPGVPVFGALPHPEPEMVYETGKTEHTTMPVKLEWFNGSVPGQNLAHEEMKPNAEYMVKEKWPEYLDADFCSRMTFDLIPNTSGNHILSVVSTGHAICYVNGEKVYDRPQETDLKPESFYFFKSKLERRFQIPMEAGKRYTLVLESWATYPEILTRLNGRMFQGSALRFHEYIDVPKCISDAVDTAAASDYAVVFVGTTNEIESEGYDRDTMDLSKEQYDLIHAVVAKNPKTIVVNFSGAPVSLTQFIDQVPVLLQAWFPGQECGHSVAQILAGTRNPGGRLPFSWPKRLEDNPSFGNFPAHDNILKYEEGLDIGYRYYDRVDAPDPLFPFGYGLSFTTFKLGQLSSDATFSNSIKLSCDVENVGDKLGKVVVQFYIEMPEIKIGRKRPIKELKGFIKKELSPQQKETVNLELDKYAISFYDANEACWKVVAGEYKVHVGFSVKELISSTKFVVPTGFTWTGI